MSWERPNCEFEERRRADSASSGGSCGRCIRRSAPTENATGCYRREFVLPEDWAGKQIMLRFEGVDSAFHVWLNGRRWFQQRQPPARGVRCHGVIQAGAQRAGRARLQVQRRQLPGRPGHVVALRNFPGRVILLARLQTCLRDFCVQTELDENYAARRFARQRQVAE